MDGYYARDVRSETGLARILSLTEQSERRAFQPPRCCCGMVTSLFSISVFNSTRHATAELFNARTHGRKGRKEQDFAGVVDFTGWHCRSAGSQVEARVVHVVGEPSAPLVGVRLDIAEKRAALGRRHGLGAPGAVHNHVRRRHAVAPHRRIVRHAEVPE